MANDNSKTGAGTPSLGAGAEAAVGVHAQHGQSDAGAQQAQNADARPAAAQGTDREGSEPLERDREHKPSYGGEGGAPRTSSDNREPH
jgi:hypothetical protein